jgi:hypothetical protein
MIQQLYKYLLKNWIDITLIVLILLSITIFIVLYNNDNKENDDNNTDNIKQHTSIITIQQIEGMTNEKDGDDNDDETSNNKTHKDLLSRMKQGFCSVHSGNSEGLEKDCNLLSKQTCNKTQCCIFAYNEENIDGKCVAGSQFGPTYHSDENGINHDFDYYYYMGKKYN